MSRTNFRKNTCSKSPKPLRDISKVNTFVKQFTLASELSIQTAPQLDKTVVLIWIIIVNINSKLCLCRQFPVTSIKKSCKCDLVSTQ